MTLKGELERRKSSYVIPVRFPVSGKGNRKCTYDMKIAPIARWIKQRGTSKDSPGVVGLGISLDEMQRMRTSSGVDHYTLEYPLVQMRLTRMDCLRIIERAGLPHPPKSSCFFCPFHTMEAWRNLRDTRPDLFEESARIEDMLGDRMQHLQGQRVYLSDARRSLRDAVGDSRQLDMFEEEGGCESGFCFT